MRSRLLGRLSPVQISVGGVLGADGATLLTDTADQPLVPSWREIVAAECGGGERHGFRVALPAGSAGRDVFVYGIDLNVPGAPFSLLRGGKKTAPGGSPLPNPRAAIFTGWVEPEGSGAYLFNVDAGPGDKFRLWVNGLFVAGNWKDPITTPPTPGAFTLDPPSPPPMPFLHKGIRYAVRVEYLRPDASPMSSSHLQVTWSRPTANPAVLPQPIPTTALYAMAQSSGNGLQGTYFPGVTSLASLPPDNFASTLPRTFGAVDHGWNDGNPPVAGLSVGDSFGARFEGQLVPPISGDYTFSLDTDGVARVFVNGVEVVTVSRQSEAPEQECEHDICVVGPLLSTACEQNNFCVESVCAADLACCSQTWDGRCVEQVKRYCQEDICAPTSPGPITLSAGWKYDVRVEYQHRGSMPDEPVRGGKLKLMWSLAGSPREVLPAVRLFAATAAPAAQLGTGLNAAYFTDAELKQEYFNRVEATIGFQAASPPIATRAGSLICGNAGAPTCGPAPAPSPPALAAAETFQANDFTMALILRGGGAVPGASLTVFEVKEDGTLVTLGSPVMHTTAGGDTFVTAPLTVERRRYVVQARQSVGGQNSALTEKLAVNVTDPFAPPPPIANGSGGPDGTVTVGGTAGSAAGVNVVVKVEGTTAEFAHRGFTADGNGSWTGSFTLPPGSYELTVTQTAPSLNTSRRTGPDGEGQGSGARPHRDRSVGQSHLDLPDANLPGDGQRQRRVDRPRPDCRRRRRGRAHRHRHDSLFEAEVDRFFVDLPTEPPAIVPNADGSFAGQVALDQGRHRLKSSSARTASTARAAAHRCWCARRPEQSLSSRPPTAR